MKTNFFTLVLVTGITTLMISSCSFLKGTGSATTDNNSLCLNYKNSEKSQLEVGLIHQMTDNYQRGSNATDAQVVRLELETLKKFIYHLEMEAEKRNVSSQDLSVRIYYARYPKKSTWNRSRDLSGFLNDPITEQYEMKHTVVMIPTIKKGSIHYDFNPLDSDTYANGLNSQPVYLPSTENPLPITLTFGLSITKPTTSAQNHGQMYPPYSDPGMTFY